MKEYPLYNHYQLCPTARFVGGVSRYLCECNNPRECEGIKAVDAERIQVLETETIPIIERDLQYAKNIEFTHGIEVLSKALAERKAELASLKR